MKFIGSKPSIHGKNVEEYYDNFTEYYALTYDNWDECSKKHGLIVHSILSKYVAGYDEAETVLDCTCGIGTQAIGLALCPSNRLKVIGSDLSSREIEKAKVESVRLGVDIDFHVADMRSLRSCFSVTFDIIFSFDNAVVHLDSDDLPVALESIRDRLKDGGTLLISVREYDRWVQEKPTGIMPERFDDDTGSRVYFQTWQWIDDPSADVSSLYQTMYLLLRASQNQLWEVKSVSSKFMAWRKDQLLEAFGRAGFRDVEWLTMEETGFHQQIVKGVK